MADEEQWQVVAQIPARLPKDVKDSLFAAIAAAVHSWEPSDRDGWDVFLSGYPADHTTEAALDRKLAVLEFLIARHEAERRNKKPRCFGRSSDALAYFAAGRATEPGRSEYPADRWDLDACERTYDMAPEFLKARMLPVLEKFRAGRGAGA